MPDERDVNDPRRWTYRDAAKRVDEATYGLHPASPSLRYQASTAPRRAYDANRRLIEEHDFWQRGERWIGPGSDPALPHSIRYTTLRRVEPQFTPIDVVGEIIDRAGNALLKREADVQFTPIRASGSDEPDEAASEAAEREAAAMLEAVSVWWDRERLWEHARRVMRRQLWAGRGGFRVRVPPGYLNDTDDGKALPEGLAIADAFERVKLETPQPHEAAVVVIEETQQAVAIILTTRTVGDREERVAEVWMLAPSDDDATSPNEMLVRVLVDRYDTRGRPLPSASADEEYRLDLTRLPLAEAEGELLLTDPERRQQDQINFMNTMLSRVTETAGFPERTFINAAPHGEWYPDPPRGGAAALQTQEFDGKTWYLHAVPHTVGSAVTTELHGYETDTVTEPDGTVRRSYTTPQVVYREPTNPKYLHDAIIAARGLLLSACKQGFVLTTTTGSESGYSRVQARAEFVEDQLRRKPSLEGAVRDIIAAAIETAQLMAAPDAAIRPGFLERFRVVVNLHVDAGPVSPEERRIILEEYKAGVRSRALTMAMLGTEDIDAELEAMEREEPAQLQRIAAYATTLAELSAVPGVSIEGAVRAMAAIGLDKRIARAMIPRDTDGAGALNRTPEAELARRGGGLPDDNDEDEGNA